MENKCSDPEPCCFFHVPLCSAIPICSALPALILLGPAFFFLIFIYSNVPSALLSFFLLFLPSFLYLLCSSCSARWGCLPFCKKRVALIPPSKNSRHFFKKTTLPSIHLTHHILRTVSHLASYHSDGITFSAIHLER